MFVKQKNFWYNLFDINSTYTWKFHCHIYWVEGITSTYWLGMWLLWSFPYSSELSEITVYRWELFNNLLQINRVSILVFQGKPGWPLLGFPPSPAHSPGFCFSSDSYFVVTKPLSYKRTSPGQLSQEELDTSVKALILCGCMCMCTSEHPWFLAYFLVKRSCFYCSLLILILGFLSSCLSSFLWEGYVEDFSVIGSNIVLLYPCWSSNLGNLPA